MGVFFFLVNRVFMSLCLCLSFFSLFLCFFTVKKKMYLLIRNHSSVFVYIISIRIRLKLLLRVVS